MVKGFRLQVCAIQCFEGNLLSLEQLLNCNKQTLLYYL